LKKMKLSVIIPAYNEADSLRETVSEICETLLLENIPHEILVVNDNSGDHTIEVLEGLQSQYNTLRYITSTPPNGFGLAVRKGLDHYVGDCVAIMMADLSDSPHDLVMFYRLMVEKDLDCVFGNRFVKGGKVVDYPRMKLSINRLANWIVAVVFGFGYKDCTNAFKLYKRTTIDGVRPLLSPHFNLTLELPLKAIVRGYSYGVVPNSWRNRKHGESKLKIREMGSRYFFILCYCLIEKYFSKGDYKKSW